MNEIAFAVHLGGGLYMDSNGGLHQGTAPHVPIYEAPFKLPVDPKAVKSALTEVGDALKGANKNNDLVLLFHVWKAEKTILDIISTVGKIAGAIAPVFAAIGVAVDIAKFLKLIKEGPSPFEQMVIQRFDELEANIAEIAELIRIKDLRNGRIAVENFANAVKDYADLLQHTAPSITQLENDRHSLLGAHASHIDTISTLLDRQTWITMFDSDEHKTIWPSVQHVLFTLPGGPRAAPKPAPIPIDGSNQFDHRLMVPLACYAAESYLACIRGISPEYRSTGDFQSNLRTFARKLDEIAQVMRESVLGRTIYKPEHFGMLIPFYEVIDDGVLPGTSTPRLMPQRCNHWPVGALDLRYHTDVFFDEFLRSLWRSDTMGWPHSTKFAGFDVRWVPPAELVKTANGNYLISNVDECAAAANAQSAQDYANLLSISGYTELLQLATLFRNEATEPDKSQTVYTGRVFSARNSLASQKVVVKSNPALITGKVITASASREPQECLSTVRIDTQPLKRAIPITYRIKLRTLGSIHGDKSWLEPTYADYYRTSYEPDPDNPGFLRLAITTTTLALDEHVVVGEWTSSPRDDLIHDEGIAEMTADTFDWWIPVVSPYSVDVPFHKMNADLRGHGWSGAFKEENFPPFPEGMQFMLSNHPLSSSLAAHPEATLTPELFWKPGSQTWDGQHRELKRKTVRVKYSVDWLADRMSITIQNDIADRNYVVYAVVEEMLPGSGKALHTAVAMPMNGLLTYIPAKFFTDEFEAHAKSARLIQELAGRYILTNNDIGPPDPIAWIHPGDLASSESMSQIVKHIRENHPSLFENLVAASVEEGILKTANRRFRQAKTRRTRTSTPV